MHVQKNSKIWESANIINKTILLKSINFDQLPIKDIFYSGIIIFLMSVIIANIYNPLLGFIYSLGNIVTLTFLSWLYKDTWTDPAK